MTKFVIQFGPADIPLLAKQYCSGEDDKDALEAGRQIRSGLTTRANLTRIFVWKTGGRGVSRLKKNTDLEIADALRLALDARTERAAVAVLLGLSGVAVPVASAILTAIYPKRFTVIDFRALEALGTTETDRSIDYYLAYLGECRRIAKRHAVSLRDLDRALWQWSKNLNR